MSRELTRALLAGAADEGESDEGGAAEATGRGEYYGGVAGEREEQSGREQRDGEGGPDRAGPGPAPPPQAQVVRGRGRRWRRRHGRGRAAQDLMRTADGWAAGCSLQAGGTAVVECRVLVSCCAPCPPAVGGGSACPVFILGWVAFAWAFWSNCPFFVISQSITVVHLLKNLFFSTELEGSKPQQKFIKMTKSYRETKQQNSKATKRFQSTN